LQLSSGLSSRESRPGLSKRKILSGIEKNVFNRIKDINRLI
jgi:hypothetical protein